MLIQKLSKNIPEDPMKTKQALCQMSIGTE